VRWLIGHPGPQFSVADVYEGWAEALRNLGEQVFTFNLDKRLQFFDAACIGEEGSTDPADPDAPRIFRKAMTREVAIETAAHEIIKPLFLSWPDVVFLVSAFFMPPYLLDAMRGRGMRVVLLHTESPYQDDEQLTRAAHADLNLVNDPANLDAYRELGPAAYMPHAYREQVHYPAGPRARRRWDLSFVGTGFSSRIAFFSAMNLDGLAVNLAGPWFDLPEDSPLRDWTMTDNDGCVDNDQTAGIYRRSRTGINFYRREGEQAHAGQGWAMGPREIELAACGTWFCRDPRPESDQTFPMLPAFGSPEEAGDLIRWALAHPRERARAAAQAREAIADRTFTNHARRLLALLDT
jgi:hypothetical protein